MDGVRLLTPALGQAAACQALGVWRGQPQRELQQQMRRNFVGPHQQHKPRPCPPLALDLQERQELLLTLNSERFADCAPATVYATLLDEGRFLGALQETKKIVR